VVAKGSGRKSAQWGEGRVAFAALAPEIAKALEEGLPMTKVYALFEARLGMSYRQFVRYANPSRPAKERQRDPSPRPLQKPVRAEARDRPPSPRQLPGASDARGFHFDPSDIDSKKLI